MPTCNKRETIKHGKQVFDKWARSRSDIIGVLLMATPLSLTLLVSSLFFPNENSTGAVIVLLIGIILTVLGGVVAFRWGAKLFSPDIRPRVQAKLEAIYNIDLQYAPFIGISPGRELRIYEDNSCWDVGFLLLEEGRMRYFGDISAFELTSDQVECVEETEILNALITTQIARMYLIWRESEGSDGHALAIEHLDADSFEDEQHYLSLLRQQLDKWKRNSTSPASVKQPELGLPPLPENCTAPAVFTRSDPCPHPFLRTFLTLAVIGLGTGFLFGKIVKDASPFVTGAAVALLSVAVAQIMFRRKK